jgi:hypothetical protein
VRRTIWVVAITLIFAALACNAGTQSSATERGSSEPTTTPLVDAAPATAQTAAPTATPAPPTPTDIPLPEHRIGIRQVDGVGQFYNRDTGETFVPRGFNYLHMAEQDMAWGETRYQDATFATDHYDAGAAATALRGMHDLGYNVVRVFLTDAVTGFVGHGTDFLPGYIDNVANFLNSAADNDIYVIFTIDWLPGGRYGELQNRYCCDTFAMTNVQLLTTGGVDAHGMVFADLYRALVDRDAPIENIFSFELRNEVYFSGADAPFTLTETVTTANGKSYDMTDDADRQAMINEGLVYYIDRARELILEADPTALVSVGFFVPQGPIPVNIGDPRLVATAPAIWESSADFIDLHPYPGFSLNLAEHVTNFGMEGMETKPIIMGEFGAFRQNYASAAQGAQALVRWQVESCPYGFDGWLVWHWDTAEDTALWNAQDGDAAIARALAPTQRPDPCVP